MPPNTHRSYAKSHRTGTEAVSSIKFLGSLRRNSVGFSGVLGYCGSCCSVAVRKHYEQRQFKEEFVLAHGSRDFHPSQRGGMAARGKHGGRGRKQRDHGFNCTQPL